MTERQKKIRAEAKARIKKKKNEEMQLEKLYNRNGELVYGWQIRVENLEYLSGNKYRNERLKLQRLGYIIPKKKVGRYSIHKLDFAYYNDNSLPETKCGLHHSDDLKFDLMWLSVTCPACLKQRI
jgi:hypothetical protein